MSEVSCNKKQSQGISILKYASPLEWLTLVLGLVAAINYSWMMDDSFVFFRYVDNLVFLNNGLVFNRGEYAEGFSSPLWCLILIPLRATGLDFWIIVRLLGIASFVAFWLLLIKSNRILSPKKTAMMNFPLLFLAFNYGVSSYFTSGLEAPLVLVSAALFALAVLKPASMNLHIFLAFTPLVRHELALPLVMIGVWCWWKNKRFPFLLTILSVIITGAWLLFRIYYYADLLPTTFYLKDMINIQQGLYYLHNVLWPYKVYFILPIAAFAIWNLYRQINKRGENQENLYDVKDLKIPERLFMLALAAGITAYVIKIGGDSRHFRYLAFPFVLTFAAMGGIVEYYLKYFHLEKFGKSIFIGGVLVIMHSFLFVPHQFMVHPTNTEKACERMPKKSVRPYANFEWYHKIGDAMTHRCTKSLSFNSTPWGGAWDFDMQTKYKTYQQKHEPFVYDRVSHGNWCLTLYKRFFRFYVHNLGLTDAVLARMIMKESKPAHKIGLRKYAKHMVKIMKDHGGKPGRGMYRKSVQENKAPTWVVENIDSIEIIEKKIYNTHDFMENLSLAFSFPKRIDPKKGL